MKKKNSFWVIFVKILLIIILASMGLVGVFFVISYGNHKSKLKAEKEILAPPGQIIEVDGNDIHVLKQGNDDSEYTLVFLPGSKTVDDAVALQPLFNELSDYKLMYVDRSGIGYSEDAGVSKKVDAMVEQTRTALKAVDDSEKYILVASKAAGVMAIYWAQTYPEEVQAIIGFHMFTPEQYVDLADDTYCKFSNKMMVNLVKLGTHRYSKGIYPGNDFSLYTDKQMEIRNALISKGLYTKGMCNEDKEIVKNAKLVTQMGWPEDTDMFLIYANPFMDPYLHQNDKMMDMYEEISEQGDEYDCVAAYNEYYRELLEKYDKVKMTEISGPERLYTYNPSVLADLMKEYIDILK